jgi:hypothetical protein
MGYINKKDNNGIKSILLEGELGYDAYEAGGDAGRIYVGTGTENIAIAKKSEVDSVVAGTTNIIYDNTVSGLIATTVKSAIDEVEGRVDTAESDINSLLLRADRYLAAQSVANMIYTDSKLTKVRYVADTDTDYEVLSYNTQGKLINVAHYVDTVLEGNTALSYTSDKLSSAIYTGV